MDYGLSTYFLVDERLSSRALDRILAAGFSRIEIFAARQHFDYCDPHHVRDVAEWFADHPATLTGLHAPLYNDFDWGRSGGLAISIAYLERRLRINSMEEIKRAIEVAEKLPFRFLILHMGLPEEEYLLEKHDAALTSLEHLNIFAKERGAQILLENIPNELTAPQRLLQFIEHSRMDLKVCFDTGHAHLAGGVEPAFQALKDHLLSTHIHDNRRDKDEHLMPFEGDIDWAKTMRDFRSSNNSLPLVFEVRNAGKGKANPAKLRAVLERMEALA